MFRGQCLFRFKVLNSFTVYSVFVESCCVLRASTERDNWGQGREPNAIPVLLVPIDMFKGAQPRNRKAGNELCSYVWWQALWGGQRAEREDRAVWWWTPAGTGRGEGSTCAWVVREGLSAEVVFPLKLDKRKQPCQDCKPDSRQRKSAGESNSWKELMNPQRGWGDGCIASSLRTNVGGFFTCKV